MTYEPAGAIMQGLAYYRRREKEGRSANMNPAPPVISIFFASDRGSNLVDPVRTGASFQIPVSWKWRWIAGVLSSSARCLFESGSGLSWEAAVRFPGAIASLCRGKGALEQRKKRDTLLHVLDSGTRIDPSTRTLSRQTAEYRSWDETRTE